MDKLTRAECLHMLRNPYGYSEEQMREARLFAADELEHLSALACENCAAPLSTEGSDWLNYKPALASTAQHAASFLLSHERTLGSTEGAELNMGSKTPKTDTIAHTIYCGPDGRPMENVPAMFARSLELALARRDALLREALEKFEQFRPKPKFLIARIEREIGGGND